MNIGKTCFIFSFFGMLFCNLTIRSMVLFLFINPVCSTIFSTILQILVETVDVDDLHLVLQSVVEVVIDSGMSGVLMME